MNTFIDPYALGLHVTSVSGFEAHCLCPFHNDNKPSAEFNMAKHVFHCFACGVSSGLRGILSVTGGQVIYTERPVGARSDNIKDYEWINHTELAIHDDYLGHRGVTDEQVRLHSIRRTSAGVIFPLQDMSTIIGAQMRRFDNQPRYLTFGRKPPIWPMTTLENMKRGETLFIVEGVFGVLRAELAGVKAVAVLGAGSIAKSIPWLSNQIRKVIVFDNDDAGYIGAAKLCGAIRAEVVLPGCEADELTVEQWQELASVKRFSRSQRAIISLAKEEGKAQRIVEKFFRSRAL